MNASDLGVKKSYVEVTGMPGAQQTEAYQVLVSG